MNTNPALKEATVQAYQTLRSQTPWQHEGTGILHHRVLPFATLAPWLADPTFMALYEQIQSNTLVDIYRCYELWSLAQQARYVEGDVLEVGVWRGGTGAILASALKDSSDKTIFLADTFEGVVKAGMQDTRYKGGEHADTSVQLVESLMVQLALPNTRILKGIFPDDTQAAIPGKIAFLHCDVDVYSSSKDIVEWCLPRLSVGASLVFDDYGFFGCEGVTRFCNELRNRKDMRFIHNLNGHAIFVKLF